MILRVLSRTTLVLQHLDTFCLVLHIIHKRLQHLTFVAQLRSGKKLNSLLHHRLLSGHLALGVDGELIGRTLHCNRNRLGRAIVRNQNLDVIIRVVGQVVSACGILLGIEKSHESNQQARVWQPRPQIIDECPNPLAPAVFKPLRCAPRSRFDVETLGAQGCHCVVLAA
jgi:hypothetical protein